ncbi:hypothetical protein CLPUN_38880 [Clostridium puniceum]|uniref:Uncharacterized protein n=1 Tax=Clostridium puniceum TaxID=29367 RepID=A0A1S8TAH5_9CLOT|nr:hypothetical protein [Clostridium puniceum]OOM74435.1 hypothetical protein CLPUN_38880 [Clostridium puniceum]
MKVNINRTNTVKGYATRDITNIEVEEYTEIVICLKIRLETLEEKNKEYKKSDDERLKKFIPNTESEIKKLTKIIEILQ